jgi:nitrile hydratase accessory protein
MQGVAALPRKNGELVFHEPWESRAFGMTVALHRSGLYPWDAFRHGLIVDIRQWEAQGYDRTKDEWSYYEHWLNAFQKLLVERGVLTPEEIEARTAEFASGVRDDAY